MSTWNIQPAEVGAILDTVFSHIGDEEGTSGLTGDTVDLGDHLVDADTHAASAPIGQALSEFAEHYFGVLGEAIGLASGAVNGAGEATLHYVNGNLEMAAEAQDAVIAADLEEERPPGVTLH
ncbi:MULTISPECIES: DUF6507 family protein [Nocardiopsis]|uniref:DUF6507 family protein n=1 Tax=Nocardiopsis lambiniae TaxID=3075539 RepID=A0ABU2M997_9ACTN|nr:MULTISPECIES: DUF6507 family protein [unclassified Nocardiopsis]MDE3723290.1 DUF6507 family protein [Nocardiopsis sp. N85]MDT0329182.1 DUF6507 family protein [Nocardiopsis sp. DSM 44743]